MVFCVSWIGVDFRPADKLKSRFASELNNKILTYIAIACQRVLRFIGAATVFLNAQNTAGF
jgi:hypothetical protein